MENSFWMKLVLSAPMLQLYFLYGWTKGQNAVILPDIIELTHVTTEQGSNYMTTYYAGYVPGCILCAFFFDFHERSMEIMFLLSTLTNGIAAAFLPWCRGFVPMAIVFLFIGISTGVYDTAMVAGAVLIWKIHFGIYFQIANSLTSLGNIVSPLATEPYLVQRHQYFVMDCNQSVSSGIQNSEDGTKLNATLDNSNTSNCYELQIENGLVMSQMTEEESNLYIALYITAGISLLISVQYVVMIIWYIKYGPSLMKTDISYEKVTNRRDMAKNLKNCCMILTFTLLMLMLGSDLTFNGFLPLFVVRHFQWTPSDGSYIVACVGFINFASRVIGIFALKTTSKTKLIATNIIVVIIGFGGIIWSSFVMSNTGLWISSCVTGAALTNIYPAVVGWMNENLTEITGRISALLSMISHMGGFFNSWILGYGFDNISSRFFCDLLEIESVLGLITFIVLILLMR